MTDFLLMGAVVVLERKWPRAETNLVSPRNSSDRNSRKRLRPSVIPWYNEGWILPPPETTDCLWSKYGDILEAVQKKLHQASDTIDKAKARPRAFRRKLKDVQELLVGEASVLLSLDVLEDNGTTKENDSVGGNES